MTREDEIQPETDDQPAADETEDALDGTEAEDVKAVEQDEEKQTESGRCGVPKKTGPLRAF